MHDLLTRLLQANLAAAAAIVLILVLRKSVRTLFGARIAYGLWLLVPLVAAASLAPPRPADLLPVPIASAPLVQAAEATAEQLWTWGADAAAPAGLDPMTIVLGLWLIGLVLMAAWLAMRQSQFLFLLRHGEAGRAVIGFLKPRIITPSDFEERFDVREQTLVLAHEKIHLVRHDARINALVALARCLCWFNPLVHIAAHLMRVDQELACDAAVVERHPKARAPYAQALLKAQLAATPLPLGCYWPAGTEHPLTERIAMLKKANPSAIRRLSGAALLTLLAAGAGYAAWAAAPATAPVAAAPLTYIEAAIPKPAAAEPAPVAAKPAAPRYAATPAPAELAAADVCAANNCAQPAAAAPPTPAPTIAKVPYVGAAPIPAKSPFVRYFDAASPILIHGRVAEVRMSDTQSSEVMVQGDDGKLYRVIGGTADNWTYAADLPGKAIDVRGYLAYDKSCDAGCLVNGRDVTYPDGKHVFYRQTTP